MEFLIVLAVLTGVALFVTRPLWRAPAAASGGDLELTETGGAEEVFRPDPAATDAVAELEAARDAKYREILDAELDRRTGKLSDEDYEAINRSLRGEAVEILDALDDARDRLPSHD
jgi:hypothetical protein